MFLADNRIPVLTMDLNGYRLMAGVQAKDGYVRFEYSICSPRDQFSKKIGRGKLGQKLKAGKGHQIHAGSGSDISLRLRILAHVEGESGTPRKMFKGFLS